MRGSMKKIILITSIFLFMGFHVITFAQDTSNVGYCPLITEITKDPTVGDWKAQTHIGAWKSRHLSFANKITGFTGAQWNGANVGQITCIYSAEQIYNDNNQRGVQQSFPVLLQYGTLTYVPAGGKWHRRKQGRYNCRARSAADLPFDQSSCPFHVRMQKASGDIYQEAEELKK